jgi:uncharacterized protein YkwD
MATHRYRSRSARYGLVMASLGLMTAGAAVSAPAASAAVSATALRGADSGRCLDVPGGQTDSGTELTLWDCDGGGNQQWSGITPAAPAGTAAMTGPEKQAFDNVNARRTANGCAALVIDESLQKAAHDYAAEMVRTHNFSHTSASGKSPTGRARAAGYTRGGVGENIAMGFRGDPNGVVDNATYGWMGSSSHRANILNCGYTRTGMGYDAGNIDPHYAGGSWVQVFG